MAFSILCVQQRKRPAGSQDFPRGVSVVRLTIPNYCRAALAALNFVLALLPMLCDGETSFSDY